MDREKVIKAVEEAFDLVHSDYIGTYDFDETEWEKNKADALSLLKEQEESIPVSWLTEKLEGHPELPYAVTDGINNVLDLWEGR